MTLRPGTRSATAPSSRGAVSYENYCAAVFTVRDGQIHAVREYVDTLYAYRAVFGDA